MLSDELNLKLNRAVRDEDYETVSECLEGGANANFIDDEGMTPLYISALTNNLPIAKLLLQYEADPDWQDNQEDNETALYWATDSDNPKFVKALIKAGTALNVYNTETTPLDLAFQKQRTKALPVLLGGHIALYWKTLPANQLKEAFFKLKNLTDLNWNNIEAILHASSELNQTDFKFDESVDADSVPISSDLITDAVESEDLKITQKVMDYAFKFMPKASTIAFFPVCIDDREAQDRVRSVLNFLKSVQQPNNISNQHLCTIFNIDCPINFTSVCTLDKSIEENVKTIMSVIELTYKDSLKSSRDFTI